MRRSVRCNIYLSTRQSFDIGLMASHGQRPGAWLHDVVWLHGCGTRGVRGSDDTHSRRSTRSAPDSAPSF